MKNPVESSHKSVISEYYVNAYGLSTSRSDTHFLPHLLHGVPLSSMSPTATRISMEPYHYFDAAVAQQAPSPINRLAGLIEVLDDYRAEKVQLEEILITTVDKQMAAILYRRLNFSPCDTRRNKQGEIDWIHWDPTIVMIGKRDEVLHALDTLRLNAEHDSEINWDSFVSVK